MAKLDDGPILYSTYFEIIKLSFFLITITCCVQSAIAYLPQAETT